MIRILSRLPAALWLLLITYLPGDVGDRLRYRYWARRLRALGRNVRIDVGVNIHGAKYVEIGDNVWIDRHVCIMAGIDRSEREKVSRRNSNYRGDPGVSLMEQRTY